MHGQAIARGDVITPEAAHDPSRYVAPDCAGLDFFAIDGGLCDLLGSIWHPIRERRWRRTTSVWAIWPADDWTSSPALPTGILPSCTPATASAVTRTGSNIIRPIARWSRSHSATSSSMPCRIAVACWPDRPLPPVAKYAFQYLFVQGEFGLMCPSA